MWASREIHTWTKKLDLRVNQMTVYAITYDLNRPGQNYQDLYDEIKGLGAYWWHYLDSMWLVSTNLSANQVSERIRKHCDTNDHFLVIRVVANYQGWLPEEAWSWINRHVKETSYA